jgi:hypothetical protein
MTGIMVPAVCLYHFQFWTLKHRICDSVQNLPCTNVPDAVDVTCKQMIWVRRLFLQECVKNINLS